MKTRYCLSFVLAAVFALTVLLKPMASQAQGSLTPPGAPGPTMVTLQQIEPRTPISSLPFGITQPGSYYLTTNLTLASGDGIFITSGNWTLDLNGFTMQGTSGAGNALFFNGTFTNITVRNGTIRGWPGNGVDAIGPFSSNLVFERLTVCENGGEGFYIPGSAIVRDCIAASNSAAGIDLRNGGLILNCEAVGNVGDGIFTINGSIVRNCRSMGNGGRGIYVSAGTVEDCQVRNNGGSGIYADPTGSQIIGNDCTGNNTGNSASGAGIYVNSTYNRIEGNHLTLNGYAGISVASGNFDNIIIKNSVIGNGGSNYLSPTQQIMGPLITNTVSGFITNSNPWANFSF